MSGGFRVALATVATALLVPTSAMAASFKVTTGADPAPGKCTQRDCSLREAVRTANRRDGRDTIVLRSGRSHGLDAAGTGEDSAKTGDLDVLGPTTIRASKKQLATIDANGVDRVLHMQARVKLDRLKITGGAIDEPNQTGFGILAQTHPLEIRRSVITRNQGAGSNASAGGLRMGAGGSVVETTISANEVAAGGGGAVVVGTTERSLLVRDSTISGNVSNDAGGMIVSSNARVVESRIADNTAYQCGGLTLTGAVLERSRVAGNETVPTPSSLTFGGGGVCLRTGSEIRNSTIANNFASADGGGVDVFGGERIIRSTIAGNTANDEGGGVNAIFSDPFTITGSTLSDNIAGTDGGGLRAGSARVIVRSSTIHGNEGVLGGGIVANDQPTGSNDSLVELRFSTIVANNSGSGGGIGGAEGGTFLSEGTLIGANLGSPAPDCSASVSSAGHNLVGDTTGCTAFTAASDITGIDPQVLPLADNGGPTETVVPGAGSDAIDGGGEDCPEKDQRGTRRPRGGGCDIGSVEAR